MGKGGRGGGRKEGSGREMGKDQILIGDKEHVFDWVSDRGIIMIGWREY